MFSAFWPTPNCWRSSVIGLVPAQGGGTLLVFLPQISDVGRLARPDGRPTFSLTTPTTLQLLHQLRGQAAARRCRGWTALTPAGGTAHLGRRSATFLGPAGRGTATRGATGQRRRCPAQILGTGSGHARRALVLTARHHVDRPRWGQHVERVVGLGQLLGLLHGDQRLLQRGDGLLELLGLLVEQLGQRVVGLL